MSTTKNKKIIKLQESTQKRNEAWIEVDKCVSLYRHDLPQEFIDAWGGFESLAEEVEAIEVEAINGIEQGLDRLQKSINKEKEIFGLSQRCSRQDVCVLVYCLYKSFASDVYF